MSKEQGQGRAQLKQRIVALLRERHELTSSDVATSCGIKRNVATAMLHYLRKQGLVERDEQALTRRKRGPRARAYRLAQA